MYNASGAYNFREKKNGYKMMFFVKLFFYLFKLYFLNVYCTNMKYEKNHKNVNVLEVLKNNKVF